MQSVITAVLGGVLAILLAGCASSKPGGAACDPGAEVCACDATVACPSGYECDASGTCVVGGDEAVDGRPRKGFGEPCADRTECESDICIFIGTGGRCTIQCIGGDCPTAWGCLGVVDVIEPGTVSAVCVPVVDQLCSACTSDAECLQVGDDRCLEYADGKEFCARDCRTIACPNGFVCQDQSAGGEVIRQCVPASGACDCDATSMGMQESCTIMTPFNTACSGTRTCQGATGWGGCAPPAPSDDPDGSYVDANCDGIDGDVTRGVFVAGGGANTPTCGLTSMAPCQTISYGIIRAATAGRTHVFVQTGTYNEVVVLVNGVNVWGGYSFGWQRGPYSNPAHRVTITGGHDTSNGGDGEYLGVRAHGLIVPVTIGDVIIDAPDAAGTVAGNGRSSYGVHVDGATVVLERVQILGGNGAPGAPGTSGTDAVIVGRQSYMDGSVGGDGREYDTVCDTSGRGGGGARGANTCSQSPSGRDMDGGAGGAGGQMDSDCGWCGSCGVCGNCTSRQGGSGADGDFRAGVLGERGYGSTETDGACARSPDPDGNPGAVGNGAGGSRQTNGFTTNGYWYARGGNSGSTGENGGGGGGGGGGAGCDAGTDAYGAGGGGGGAGGCAARAGGGGGGGGGGSFGVFVASGSATLASCAISRGNGGTGAPGGTGGRGQDPGVGNGPGQSPGSAVPGSGGAGGHGGHAGGGAGGQGGRSVGIAWVAGATVTHDAAITGGMAGSGGNGGAHAPTAPVRDGSDGQGGLGGGLDPVRTCASASDC